jgi:nicotinamidase-related amidase
MSLDELFRVREERIDRLHRLQPGRTALLVVDMQRGFLEPGAALEVPQGREIIPNVQRLIEVCRRKGVPVIFTEFVYATAIPCLRGDPFGIEHLPAAEGEPTGFGYPSSNCLIGPGADEGPNSARTIDALAPRPGELVVRSHTYGPFHKYCNTAIDVE